MAVEDFLNNKVNIVVEEVVVDILEDKEHILVQLEDHLHKETHMEQVVDHILQLILYIIFNNLIYLEQMMYIIILIQIILLNK